MNEKWLCSLIGTSLLVGAAIFGITNYANKKSMNKCSKVDDNKKAFNDTFPKDMSKANHGNLELDEIRTRSANAIHDRHTEAAQIMQESVKKISENTQLHNKHDEDFNRMRDDLDTISEER